jgi:hypothetical protein
MASVNKIELCGPTFSKSVNDVEKACEAILLPHGMHDALFITKCTPGITDLKVRLEHSPDGSDNSWAPVKYKKIISGGGGNGASWGNEKFLDTTVKIIGTDYKNKHVKVNANFGGVDIIQHKLDATSPFNLSMWMKSGEVPTTYSPQLYINTKYKYGHMGASTHATSTGHLKSNQNNMHNWSSSTLDFRNASTGWTISMWLNFDLQANTNNNLEVNTGNGLSYGDDNINPVYGSPLLTMGGFYFSNACVMVDSNGYLCYMWKWHSNGSYKDIRIPLANLNSTTNSPTVDYQDNEWRHYCITYDGDYHTASSIDSYNVYIDG